MPEDNYELLPHDELEYLRREVDRLKGNPFGEKESESLMGEIKKLNENMNKLFELFNEANQQMYKDWEDNNPRTQWKKLYEQNEKIAKSVLSLASSVKTMNKPAPQTTIQPAVIPEAASPAPIPKPQLPEAPLPKSEAAKHTEGIFTP